MYATLCECLSSSEWKFNQLLHCRSPQRFDELDFVRDVADGDDDNDDRDQHKEVGQERRISSPPPPPPPAEDGVMQHNLVNHCSN